MKKAFAVLLALLLITLGICPGALAGIHKDENGNYVDDDGNPVIDYWDEEQGIYIDEDGQAHTIEDTDDGSDSGSQGDPEGMTIGSGEYGTGEEEESSPGLTQEEWEARMRAALNRNGGITATYYLGPEKDPVPVTVIYMGLARSKIQMRGKELLVHTSDLIWDSDAPESQALAVINANRVGYANLRAKTSQKSFIMDHCLTNRVVRVISVGKTWSKVDYNGMRGYVLTGALTFYPNAMRTYDSGVISRKGKTAGKGTINVRANPKNGSRILGDYTLGTPLTILDWGEKWCEVDVEGWHCFILTEYVTLEGQDEEEAFSAKK